jgi:AcrR family transcriptional regulator
VSSIKLLKSRQEPRRLRTRAALLTAGLDLLAERSIDAIAIDEIVDAANVSKGSFFNHFQDKQEFAREIAAEIRSQVELEVTAVNDAITDPAQRLVRGICRYVRFALTEPREARVLMKTDDNSLGPAHALNAGLRADLSAGLRSQIFTAPNLDSAVLMAVGICQVLMSFVLTKPVTRAAAIATTSDLLSLVLSSLSVNPSDARALAQHAVTEIIGNG